MQELEKILEEINDRFENLTIADDECRKTALSKHNYEQVKYFQNAMFYTERAKGIVEEIIHKHMGNDGWIPVEERMPTKEECEKNQTGCIKFWITYGYRGNYSTLLANCKWVEADNEDGTTGDFAEFWVDQYPQIFYPSSNLIRGWKIIEAPDPYRPERRI